MVDLSVLRLRLAEAELARHKLNTGQLTVSVSYEGKSVTFSQFNAGRLDAYIATLRGQIADAEGLPRRRGPVQFVF